MSSQLRGDPRVTLHKTQRAMAKHLSHPRAIAEAIAAARKQRQAHHTLSKGA